MRKVDFSTHCLYAAYAENESPYFSFSWLSYRFRSVLSLSTSSFLPNFKIFYARPYQHGKPSFPPFEVHLSALRVTRKRVKGPLLLHSWPIDLFDWSPFRIHSTWGKREVIQSKGSFMQCITGGPPMLWIPPTQWMKGGVWGIYFYMNMKIQKGKGSNHILLNNLWLNEEYNIMWSHFTTIWNARNFDWWKPVHEDYPFSYAQFPSFGKHPVSQQMNISLSLSCSLYVVWKLLQGSNE